MAFSAVQNWASNRVTSGTTAALVLGTVPVAGNLLVCCYSCDNGLTATIADNIGDGVPWTVAINGQGSSINVGRNYLAYKIVGTPSGGLKTVTMTASGSIALGAGLTVAEYTATGAITIDGTPTFATAQSAVQAAGNITTTSAIGLVVSINQNNTAYSTADGTFNLQLGTPAQLTWKLSIEDKFTTAAAVYNPSWTGSVSDFWFTCVIGFKQAAAPGGSSGSFGRSKYFPKSAVVGAAIVISNIVLNWNAPATMGDGSAASGITGYNIYKSATPFDISPSLVTSVGLVLTTTISVPSGVWYFWVSAITATGESPLELAINSVTNLPYWVAL